MELPAVGLVLEETEEMALVESSKVASDVLAPLSGTVFQVNKTFEKSM